MSVPNIKAKNIVLIGMPGSGKSTLGVLLAKALGLGFLDTDIVIQQREGRMLQDIIDRDGTDAFLLCEERAICSVEPHGCVVATGGSAVYSAKAMEHLGRTGLVVYLRTPYEEISRRLRDISTRGVVLKNGATLRQTYYERAPLYEKYAHLAVDCSEESLETTLNEMVKKIRTL